MSQQIQLQASIPVVMAALYLKTGGARLYESGEFSEGVYFSGPKIITRDDLMKDSALSSLSSYTSLFAAQSSSSSSSIPSLSSMALAAAASTAALSAMSQPITLAVVTHSVTSNNFWDTVYNALAQAATDFGVTLHQEWLEEQPSKEVLYGRMVEQIRYFCSSRFATTIASSSSSLEDPLLSGVPKINGLIVTIPHEMIAEAITEQSSCRDRNIP